MSKTKLNMKRPFLWLGSLALIAMTCLLAISGSLSMTSALIAAGAVLLGLLISTKTLDRPRNDKDHKSDTRISDPIFVNETWILRD